LSYFCVTAPLGLTLNAAGLVPLGVPPPGVSGLLVPPGGSLLHQTLLNSVGVPTAFSNAGKSFFFFSLSLFLLILLMFFLLTIG
jgi:hypothetical protein